MAARIAHRQAVSGALADADGSVPSAHARDFVEPVDEVRVDGRTTGLEAPYRQDLIRPQHVELKPLVDPRWGSREAVIAVAAVDRAVEGRAPESSAVDGDSAAKLAPEVPAKTGRFGAVVWYASLPAAANVRPPSVERQIPNSIPVPQSAQIAAPIGSKLQPITGSLAPVGLKLLPASVET